VARLPCTTAVTVPVGSFQRACQAAILVGWAFAYEEDNRETPYAETVDSFFELDWAARNLVQAMVTQESRWGDFSESFSLCTRFVSLFPVVRHGVGTGPGAECCEVVQGLWPCLCLTR